MLGLVAAGAGVLGFIQTGRPLVAVLIVAGLALAWLGWRSKEPRALAESGLRHGELADDDKLPGPPLTTPPTVPWREGESKRHRDHTA